MNNDKKVFAFKLAEKKEQEQKEKATKWKAREGVSAAGCTDKIGDGSYRTSKAPGTDNHIWC